MFWENSFYFVLQLYRKQRIKIATDFIWLSININIYTNDRKATYAIFYLIQQLLAISKFKIYVIS